MFKIQTIFLIEHGKYINIIYISISNLGNPTQGWPITTGRPCICWAKGSTTHSSPESLGALQPFFLNRRVPITWSETQSYPTLTNSTPGLIYLQFFSPFNCFYKHEAQPATIQYSITGVFPEDIFSTKNQTQLFCIGLVLSRLHVKKLWGLSQKVGLSSPDIFPTMHQEMELPTHQIHVQTSGAAQPGFYSDMFTRQKCQNLRAPGDWKALGQFFVD